MEIVANQRPFLISIGKMKIIKKTVEILIVPVTINGVEFTGDPSQLREFFELLLQESPGITEGMSLDANEEFVGILLKSKVAFQSINGTLYPTEDFRKFGRDLVLSLGGAKAPLHALI
jgi:hypothetical protein